MQVDLARRLLDWTTIGLFLMALVSPAVDQCLRPDGARDCSHAENRRPEPRPVLPARASEITTFPRSYENHYMDTFGLRDVLLRWNSIELWLGLGVLPSKTFAPGRAGWCYYVGEDARDVHRGLKPFSAAELDGWVQCLRQRRDTLAERGAHYLFVLCPNKETIYPEFTPESWAPLGPTRLEQLAERLEHEGDVPFLDLRPALFAAKAEDRPGDEVYTPLGTHWNGRGSYAAYEAIHSRLAREFPDLLRVRREDCRPVDPERPDGVGTQLYIDDLLPSIAYGLELPGGRQYEEVVRAAMPVEGTRIVTQKELRAPRLLWMHDSFGRYLQRFVCESFAYVDARWRARLTLDAVDEAKPDLVLETYVERILATQTPYQLERSASPLAAQFERLDEVLWRDADASFPPAQACEGATVERQGELLHLRRNGLRDGLLLPRLEAAPDAPVLVRIGARCPGPVAVDLFVRRTGAQFLTGDNATVQLGPETPSAVARLPFLGSPFEVLVRPRPPASELEIEALEVRRGEPGAR